MEILSFPSLSEGGPLGSGASLLKKGELEGKEEWKGGGEGPESPHFIDGAFGYPFPLTPRGSDSGKGQRKDLTSKQSLEFSLIQTGLARK